MAGASLGSHRLSATSPVAASLLCHMGSWRGHRSCRKLRPSKRQSRDSNQLFSQTSVWRFEGFCAVLTVPAAGGPALALRSITCPFLIGPSWRVRRQNSVLRPSHLQRSSFQPTSTITSLVLAWLYHVWNLSLKLPTLWLPLPTFQCLVLTFLLFLTTAPSLAFKFLLEEKEGYRH